MRFRTLYLEKTVRVFSYPSFGTLCLLCRIAHCTLSPSHPSNIQFTVWPCYRFFAEDDDLPITNHKKIAQFLSIPTTRLFLISK